MNRFQRFLTRKKVKVTPLAIGFKLYSWVEFGLFYDYSKAANFPYNYEYERDFRVEYSKTPAYSLGDLGLFYTHTGPVAHLSMSLFGRAQSYYSTSGQCSDSNVSSRTKKRFDKRMFKYVNSN